MFTKKTPGNFQSPMEGIQYKTLVHGNKTLLAEFKLEAGSTLAEHQHPHEQTGYLVSGRMDLTIDGKSHEVSPGDSWCIPGEVPHGAKIIEDSIAIEVFSPVREDFLP